MRALLSTIGSRGDVQPMVALALQLRTLGHEGRICAPPDFRSWIEGFTPGYMQRAMARMPKQGDRAPWVNPQVYKAEKNDLLRAPLDDGVLQFTRARTAVTT